VNIRTREEADRLLGDIASLKSKEQQITGEMNEAITALRRNAAAEGRRVVKISLEAAEIRYRSLYRVGDDIPTWVIAHRVAAFWEDLQDKAAFPMDPDYWGAEASVFVPVHCEFPSPDASQETNTQPHPVSGDAGDQPGIPNS
jgi:hypothetical protein